MKRVLSTTLFGLAFLMTVPAEAVAADACRAGQLVKSGTVSGHGKKVGFVIGYRWGEGVLRLNSGLTLQFSIEGTKFMEAGSATFTFEGSVYNLQGIQNFGGVYTAGGHGTRIEDRFSGGVLISNPKCVVLHLKGTSEGVHISTPGYGVINIVLKEWIAPPNRY